MTRLLSDYKAIWLKEKQFSAKTSYSRDMIFKTKISLLLLSGFTQLDSKDKKTAHKTWDKLLKMRHGKMFNLKSFQQGSKIIGNTIFLKNKFNTIKPEHYEHAEEQCTSEKKTENAFGWWQVRHDP